MNLYYLKKKLVIQYLILFGIAIIGFHFIYLFWSKNEYYPIKETVNKLFTYTGRELFSQSDRIINILKISHEQKGNIFYIKSSVEHKLHSVKGFDTRGSLSLYSAYLEVSPGCTSLKQWMHWIFLMLIFPGPSKHKLWFMPAGVAILHLVNIIRITGLVCVISIKPEAFHFFHDYVFKTLFYLSIFILWVVWIEMFTKL